MVPGTDFSQKLRYMRQRRGLSQHELAKKCGLLESTISHFECGRRQPSHRNLCRLSQHLCVSLDWLMGLSEEQRLLESTAALAARIQALSMDDQEIVIGLVEILEKRQED